MDETKKNGVYPSGDKEGEWRSVGGVYHGVDE